MSRGVTLNSLFFAENPKMFPEPIYGIVDKAIIQGRLWRVRFNGSYWSARLYQPNQRITLEPGETVKVLATQGITLLIMPVDRKKRGPK